MTANVDVDGLLSWVGVRRGSATGTLASWPNRPGRSPRSQPSRLTLAVGRSGVLSPGGDGTPRDEGRSRHDALALSTAETSSADAGSVLSVPRRLCFGWRERVAVTADGVTIRRVGRSPLFVPASSIVGVTTHSPLWYAGDVPFLLCRGHRLIPLWRASHIANATWDSQRIAKVLDRHWVRWRDRRLLLTTDG